MVEGNYEVRQFLMVEIYEVSQFLMMEVNYEITQFLMVEVNCEVSCSWWRWITKLVPDDGDELWS